MSDEDIMAAIKKLDELAIPTKGRIFFKDGKFYTEHGVFVGELPKDYDKKK